MIREDLEYEHVRDAVEGILIELAEIGEAEPVGIGPEGRTRFSADPDLLLRRMNEEGLFANGVPWSWPIRALRELRG